MFGCSPVTFCWYLKQAPKQTEPAGPSLPCFMHPAKSILNAAQKKHNTHPLSVIGWNTIYFGFEWLVEQGTFYYSVFWE